MQDCSLQMHMHPQASHHRLLWHLLTLSLVTGPNGCSSYNTVYTDTSNVAIQMLCPNAGQDRWKQCYGGCDCLHLMKGNQRSKFPLKEAAAACFLSQHSYDATGVCKKRAPGNGMGLTSFSG